LFYSLACVRRESPEPQPGHPRAGPAQRGWRGPGAGRVGRRCRRPAPRSSVDQRHADHSNARVLCRLWPGGRFRTGVEKQPRLSASRPGRMRAFAAHRRKPTVLQQPGPAQGCTWPVPLPARQGVHAQTAERRMNVNAVRGGVIAVGGRGQTGGRTGGAGGSGQRAWRSSLATTAPGKCQRQHQQRTVGAIVSRADR